MLRSMKADFYRLFHSKDFYLILLIIVGIANIAPVFNFFPATGSNEATYNRMLAIKSSPWDSKIAFQGALATYVFFNYLFVDFFIIISGYDFSQKTYKNTLTVGVKRFSFVLAKNITQLLTVGIATILYFASVFICSFLKYGLSDVDVRDLIQDMILATVCLTLGISAILSLANMLLIATGSSVVATIFIAVYPIIIQIASRNTSWLWYFDFFGVIQKMAFYELSGEALISYMLVNTVLIVCSVMIGTSIIKKKEF